LRFISLKKDFQPKIDLIAREIVKHHEEKPKPPQPKNRLKQRILFQRMRRPPYNSPIKKTIRIRENDAT